MGNLNKKASCIAKLTDEKRNFENRRPSQKRRHFFLHLPGKLFKRFFNQKKDGHITTSSKEVEKKDKRAVKLWENQDYPLWELKAIAKEGSINHYNVTHFEPLSKVEEQSKCIGGFHHVSSTHKYVLLPEKPQKEELPPQPWHPDRSTDCRTRVSRL
ncbi:MAG: hypothetical protein SNF33_08360 [Candidatus Algichlamydia australiensis]|nr:hypothetical protein [Chlamydiales bacterium]